MKRIAVYCGSNKGVRPEYAAAAEQLGAVLAREKAPTRPATAMLSMHRGNYGIYIRGRSDDLEIPGEQRAHAQPVRPRAAMGAPDTQNEIDFSFDAASPHRAAAGAG